MNNLLTIVLFILVIGIGVAVYIKSSPKENYEQPSLDDDAADSDDDDAADSDDDAADSDDDDASSDDEPCDGAAISFEPEPIPDTSVILGEGLFPGF